MQIVTVSPFRCRMWALHDRLDTTITERTCRAELASFANHGQLVPVLARPLHDDSTYKYELIYGARRLFVARHLNKPLRVEVRELSDREAIIAMDMENRQRCDISAYERGMSYSRWLHAGLFQSQEELAHALKVSASQVSRLLKLARLPSVIVDAFPTPSDICEGWGLALAELLEDAGRREVTLRRARALCTAGSRPPASEVVRQLLGASNGGRRVRAPAHDEIVKDGRGAPLFRIRHQSRSIALVLPVEMVSARALAHISHAIVHILRPAIADVAEREQRVSLNGAAKTTAQESAIGIL